MYRMISFLKTNKMIFLFTVTGIILFQLIRFSVLPFYFFILITILIIIWREKERLRLKVSIYLFPLAIYIVLIVLAVLFLKNALDVKRALISVVNAFVIPVVFYLFFVASYERVFKAFENALKSLLFISVFVAVFEYIYYILFKTYKERTISIFFNPNTFAYFIVMSYPLSVAHKKNEIKNRIFMAIVFLVVILLTGSRTGLVIFCIECLLLNIDILKKEFKKIIISFIAVVALFFQKILYRIPRVSDFYNTKNAIGQRLYAIEFVFKSFQSRSIFDGVGAGQFYLYFEKHKTDDIINLHSAHNLFLNIFYEYGIIGYGVFIFLVYFVVYILTINYIKKRQYSDYSVLVGYICITIFQMFDMAEITNIKMILLSIIYVYYIAKSLHNFTRWRSDYASNV